MRNCMLIVVSLLVLISLVFNACKSAPEPAPEPSPAPAPAPEPAPSTPQPTPAPEPEPEPETIPAPEPPTPPPAPVIISTSLTDPTGDLIDSNGNPWSSSEGYLDVVNFELSLSDGQYTAIMELASPLPEESEDYSIVIEWDVGIDNDCKITTGYSSSLVSHDIGIDYIIRLVFIDSTYIGQFVKFDPRGFGNVEWEVDGNIVYLRFSSGLIGEPDNFNYVVGVRKFGERGAADAMLGADIAPNEGHCVFNTEQTPAEPNE